MWLGGAAGLALLTLSTLARPAHARNVSVNDQVLTYTGQGWEPADGPQACSPISQTMHTTSTTGDLFSFNFTGNAVYVLGPRTTLSAPMTVILDGAIQTVPPPTNDANGCGILYSNSNIATGRQQHFLVMIYAAATGSVDFSVSGIVATVPDPVTTPASLTVLQIATASPSSTISLTPASVSPTTSTSDTSSPPLSTVADAAPQATAAPQAPASASPTASAVSTSAFVTSPGMTAGLVGAIVGTIFAMLALLVIFILVRRRITLDTARKMDKENSFGKGMREREMEEAKGKVTVEDGWWSTWGSGKKAETAFDLEANVKGAERPLPSLPATSLAASIPPPIAPGSDSRSYPEVTIASPNSASSNAHTSGSTYTVHLGNALLNRSPSLHYSADMDSPPEPSSFAVAGPHSRTLEPLTIPVSIPTRLHSPPGLTATTSSGHSHRTSPLAFSSPGATLGANSATRADEKMGAHVVNRTGSVGSTGSRKTTDPPPGYI